MWNVPIFDFYHLTFPRYEARCLLLSAIKDTCQEPRPVLVIHGQPSVGKTSFLARVFSEESDFLAQCGIAKILWLRNSGQDKKKSFYLHFYRELLRANLLSMPVEKVGWERKPRCLGRQIDCLFQQAHSNGKFVVVLDNVTLIHQTLDCILRLKSNSMKFILITTDLEGSSLKSNETFYNVFRLNTLSKSEVEALSNKVEIPHAFLDLFFKVTSGFPYCVDMLLRFFTTVEQNKDVIENTLSVMEPMPNGLAIEQRVEVALHRLVYRILSEEYESHAAKLYLRLLLLNPFICVELIDLAFLWRCENAVTKELADRLGNHGLLQRVFKNGTSYFMVPSLVHAAAVKCCVRIGAVSSLNELRAKSVDVDLVKQAVDQRREELLKQIATNLDPLTLADICRNQTTFDDGNTTFLHYLYNITDWQDNDGQNVAFRLIGKFLRYLKMGGINIAEIAMLRNVDCDCLLLLTANNSARNSESAEHQLLYEILAAHGNLFRTRLNLAKQRKFWREEAFAELNDPLIIAAIKGDPEIAITFEESTMPEEIRCRNGANALIAASANGREETVTFLLAKGFDVNATDKCGSTALIEAAYFGHTNVVRILLEFVGNKAIEVNAQNLSGVTALMAACQHGFLEIVRLLHLHGANIELKNESGANCLIAAAQNGNFSTVEFLLEQGADVSVRTISGTTAMIAACQNGFVDIVEKLVNNGADLNANKDVNGNTPLMIAAHNGHKEIVSFIGRRTNPVMVNAKNNTGANSLMMTLQKGHTDIAETLLVSFGANVNSCTNNGVTPLMLSSLVGDLDAVQLLLSHKAYVKAKDERGVTALMLAAMKGHYNVTKRLIENRADIDGRDNDGVTCLMAACLGNWADVVDMLLRRGAAVNAKSKNGGSALLAAAQSGDLDIVYSLLNNPAQADVNTADNDGTTALMSAARFGHFEVAKYLLEVSNSKHNLVNRRNLSGMTALTLAVKHDHLNVARFLLSKGADINIKDKTGISTQMLASEKGYSLQLSEESSKL